MKKIKLTTMQLFVIILFCVSMTIQTPAAPGDLDPSFGNGGKVVTPIGNGDEGASAVAIQSDGKIVAAGFSFNGATQDFALVRYLSDSNTRRTQFDFDGDGKADVSFFSPIKRNVVFTTINQRFHWFSVRYSNRQTRASRLRRRRQN